MTFNCITIAIWSLELWHNQYPINTEAQKTASLLFDIHASKCSKLITAQPLPRYNIFKKHNLY